MLIPMGYGQVREEVTMPPTTLEPGSKLHQNQQQRLKLEYEKKSEDKMQHQGRKKQKNAVMRALQWLEMQCGFQSPVHYPNSIAIIVIHVLALLWPLHYLVTRQAPMWQTLAFMFLTFVLSGFGVTAGAHRYYAHRSYSATRPMQVLLLACFSMAGQNSVFNWVRDHRIHHKYSETAADPHDSNRGFFFSHIGWLMLRKRPEVILKGNTVDMSDILNDPLVKFHNRHFTAIKIMMCFVLPSVVPVWGWGESVGWAVLSQAVLRYLVALHITWSVNSFAHIFGYKPYDKSIAPVENWAVSLLAMGEGWHNYHHTFPWDWRAGEVVGAPSLLLNWSTGLLFACRALGLVYDLKSASPALVAAVRKRHRDTATPDSTSHAHAL